MKHRPCLIACLFILYLRCSRSEEKCTPGPDVLKRVFYYGEHNLTFKIEVSKRVSHQLVSHIARTLLKEILGYQHVILVEEDTDNTLRTLQKISTCENVDSCQDIDETGPDIMINLELWLQPGFNLERWINTHRVDDCGPLGPIGRAGWFIEKRVVDLLWRQNRTIVDHFKAFLNPEVTATFDLSSDFFVHERAIQTCNELPESEKEKMCGEDGFYKPPQCKNSVKCATILSDYPMSSFDTLRGVIERYGLLVNIAWLGDEFENSLFSMIGSTKTPTRNILFYHRKPMLLSSVNSFSHVKFPDCEDDITKCDFEVNQLQKVVWSELKVSALYAYQVIRNISFTQEQYNDLLKSYYNKRQSRLYTIQSIACEWLQENTYVWIKWIPTEASSKTTLYIGGIFPLTGIYWQQNATVEAAEMAAEAITNHPTLLYEYDLKILVSDGHCATDEVMKSFIQYIKSDTYKTTLGILGPACSDTVEPIAGVAKHFHTIIMSYSAEGTMFNNQEKYKFFFRTIPENNLFRYVFIKLFQKLDIKRVAALTEDGQKYPEYLSYLQDLMKDHDMTFIENRKFPRERAHANMSVYLEDLNKKGAKFIIGDFYDYAARSVMCTAYKLRMHLANGYLWFLPSWFPSNWYDTDLYNRLNNGTEHVPCTTADMLEALNGHMTLSYEFYGNNQSVMQENITIKEWRDNYKRKLEEKEQIDLKNSLGQGFCLADSYALLNTKKGSSSYGGYAYDAVWAYAYAFNRLLSENDSHVATIHSKRTATRFVELLRETNFDGVTGHVSFQNGSRISDVTIWQWRDKGYKFVGKYKALSYDNGILEMNEKNIKWLTPDGKKPDDGVNEYEYCAVEGLRKLIGGKCETAIIVANLLGGFSFITLVMIGIIVYKRRYDVKLRNTQKRMKELGWLANGVPQSLDQWEMPRENIVINRKLGEGAFGTVYGGEALVGNRGWIAVAVKTLKKRSKIEDKLDFLGEAEIMKQFDHVNIVKLVGVCTTEEPVYTIMEFMLYGDLKTYLLSRRHMVKETDRWKNEEVCDRRLTNMAMDIARGLSYLADKKYIHRDLACRNCLVNASRSVKIADFGMCRAMYDSDYYRYNKKGMLPIRWMAPESLTDGLFTPMSDVWSYGVVLYEIITFASYPYQGLSNEQVLAHVKSNKTLPVPKGCKPALESLLVQCWSSSPSNRPQAAAIVELLAQDPEMVTPCLDGTAASLEPEETGTLEIKKSFDRARGHSFSSVWQNRKNDVQQESNQLGIFDTTQLVQAGLETAHAMRQSGFKHPSKKTLHESFKKARRDLHRDKTPDHLPQITYL